MKYILTTIAASLILSVHAQQAKPDVILYGKISSSDLAAAPYNKWFDKGYKEYHSNTQTKNRLTPTLTKGISIEIFLGTWCGDSKREVPRFIKILDEIGFNMANVKIIALGGSDSLYKQSPQGEEKGKGIYRVPAFIFYRNGLEINRINEYPALSLEKDFLTIANGEGYTANYKSFASINGWMKDGILLDSNVAPRSLAMQLKQLVSNENELNSLGYLLLKQKFTKEALAVFRINANLYPESANILSSLGEGYLKNGNNEKAVQALENSLALAKDPAIIKDILPLLYQAKGIK
ncbi:MAG: hypothetical protein JNM14_01830 [Ferruginibacter sp.]|nr:hypothetical protein [Ferruginibacter sp.]